MILTKDNYKSINSLATGEYKEKGSKFLSYAIPFTKAENLKEELELLKKEHPKARHWCYAYRIGKDGQVFRSNDDGEPSGTAGKPILGQLLSSDLSDVLIVVVRYFGGTKLGVPGLIHAYKNASIQALQNAKIITKTLKSSFVLIAAYADMGVVMEVIKKLNIELDEKKFEDDIQLYFSVPKSEVERRLQAIKASFLRRPIADVQWDEKIDQITIKELDA